MFHLCIVNSLKKEKEHLKLLCEQLGITYEETTGPNSAARIARDYALRHHPIRIYACGGDGTLHEIINGVYDLEEVEIAAVPIGTGNDFIKTFNYDKDLLSDLNNYQNVVTCPIDVIQVNDHIAINTVSLGFDVLVAQNMGYFRYLRKFSSILPYWASVLLCLLKKMSSDFEIQVGNTHLPMSSYSFVVFCNGQYYGGGYHPCPSAKVDDGIIHTCFVKPIGRLQLLRLAKLYETGEHVHRTDLVRLDQCQEAKIIAPGHVLINLDGEIMEMDDVNIKILHHQVKMVFPNKAF